MLCVTSQGILYPKKLVKSRDRILCSWSQMGGPYALDKYMLVKEMPYLDREGADGFRRWLSPMACLNDIEPTLKY